MMLQNSLAALIAVEVRKLGEEKGRPQNRIALLTSERGGIDDMRPV